MSKRIIALLVMSSLLLATGCSKGEASAAGSSGAAAESAPLTTSADDVESAAENTAESAATAESAEPANDASEPAQTAESTPAEQPTEEAAQDNPLLAADAKELFVAASELKRRDASEDNVRTYIYEKLPQEDGTVAAVRTTFIAGFPEKVNAYFLSYGESGMELETSLEEYTFDGITRKIDGYTVPFADYNDPRSTIDVDGLSAEELAAITDVIFNAFYYAWLGECEGGKMSGICSYNGDNSYEWVEKLFKKFYTDEMYDKYYNEETRTLLGAYSDEDGVCVKAALAFGGPVPSVVGYEMVSSDNSEIVFRTKLYSDMDDMEWYVVSSLTNTEHGWKISRYNEDE